MQTLKLSDLFYVAESKIHGMGLFAKRMINKGEFIGTYKGPYQPPSRYYLDNFGPHVLWVVDENGMIEGRDGRNILRYMNHHAKPCAEFDGFDLFALRNIRKGSEITIHYGEEFVEAIAEGL